VLLERGDEIDHFRIEKLLGRGGMGEAYLATDLRLNRPVAVKLLRTEIGEKRTGAARFRREALAASALNHPNICSIYDVGEANGRMYIAMEYIEGTSLEERIRTGGAAETQETIEIGIQIADALEEARKKGIVHRDIKSSNIMLTPRKQVKLLDFGLAKTTVSREEFSQAQTDSHLTDTGMVLGTTSFMSPEQVLGHAVDHRSDIFSFGVVLYEMLTARLPFSGSTQTEVIDAILHKDPAPVSFFNDKVPDGLTRIIQKMLQKDMEDRYQSVHEVWSDLRQIRGKNGAMPKGSGAARLSYKRIFVAAAFIAAAVAVFLYLFPRRNPTPALTVSGISSIVALPCKVFGAPDVAYLTDAVPSTLSTLLGQVEGLDTRMPPSSVEVERVNNDLDKIANAYNVNAFVVSTITAEADRLIVNLQLVEPKSRRVLWASQYDGTRGTYNGMIRQAADGIRQVLRPASKAIASSNGLASTSEAELAFRQGLHYSYRYNNQRDPADFDSAYTSFKHALDLDSRFANAAAEISWLYGMKSEVEDQPDKSIEEANTWARKALAINDRCSKAWSGLYGAGLADSLDYALRGVKYGPSDGYAHNTLGYFLHGTTITLALNAYQTAKSLDPLYLSPQSNAANILYALGRYPEALSQCDAVLALEPNRWDTLGLKISILAELDRLSEMITLTRKMEQLNAEGKTSSLQSQMTRYVVAASENQDARAESLLNDIKRNFDSRSDFWFWLDVNSGLIPFLIHHRRIDDAMMALNKGLAAGYPVPYDLILLNPHYKSIRSDPRMDVYVSRSRTSLETVLALIEKARQRGDFPQYLEKPLADLRALIGREQQ
jgi:TolB-like protein/predicted Ser/Thr protein kinase